MAGPGHDFLTGGTEGDSFDYGCLSDSPDVQHRDTISDFAHKTDKIDLHDIDANTNTPDGDEVADLVIELTSLPVLTRGDFVL